MSDPVYPLPSRSLSEDEQILTIREAFVRHVVGDPRVLACLERVDARTHWIATADHYAPLATQLATRLKYPDRYTFLRATVEFPAIVEVGIDALRPQTPELHRLVLDTRAAYEAVVAAFSTWDDALVAAELEVCVRELGTPWRWLVLYVLDFYVDAFYEAVWGRRLVRERTLQHAPGRGAANLRPEHGETPAQFFARAQQMFQAAATQYEKARRRPKTAGEKFDGKQLERAAECIYRAHVKASPDTFYAIARDQHTEPSNIKKAIARGMPLLDLPTERLA